MSDGFEAERDYARTWLFDTALPFWWRHGADRAHGGWHDKLRAGGEAADTPKRLRVQGRQAFVYAQAGRLGWQGPWQDAVRHALEFQHRAYLRPDGLYRTTVTPDGAPADDSYDIYDHAFVLLGLVSGFTMLGRPQHLLAQARAVVDTLNARLAHPVAGYEERDPPKLPLRSNPHMHLLEALLQWVEAGGGAPFEAAARGIAGLALGRFLDPATGAVREYFDGDWQPMPGPEGGVREPGHQFEWSFLLGEAARVLGGDHARQSAQLEAFGSRGVDRARQVAVFALDAKGNVTDPDARLWSQSERLRTSLILHRTAQGAEAARLAEEARLAFATLRRFLEDGPQPGLWRDRMKPDGRFVDEPAPASSLYHIVTGLLPLIDPDYARGPSAA